MDGLGSSVKNLPAMQETQVQSLGWKDLLKEEMATTPVFLPRKFHGERSIAGYSPWGHKRLQHELATKQQQCHGYLSNIHVNLNNLF